MIGLGSNRLTVCRRGGMSVTQAGRGGMEWLAGGRVPDWITPYSAQATAALKDAFTAAQWATIRDYGVAHPALVPFINEDPMLVMSLIEGLGDRFLISDGNCWIDSGIYNPNGFHIKIKGYLISNDNQFSPIACMSNVPSGTQRNYFGADSSMRFWAGWGQYEYNLGSVQANRVYEWEFDSLQSSTDKALKVDGTTICSIGSSSYSSDSSITNVMLFGRVTGGALARHWRGGLTAGTFYGNDGREITTLAPFNSKTQGLGMLNIATLTFRPNQGSGSFTISETPAS